MMTIPDYQTLMLPVLRLAAEGETKVSDAVARLSDEFGRSGAERAELLPSGRQTTIANRVHWARTYLKQAGLLEAPSRGRFIITARGREALAGRPAHVDNAYLKQFEDFRNFVGRRSDAAAEAVADMPALQPDLPSAASATPDETLRAAHTLLTDALADALLERVRAGTPAFFEKLVVNLLLAMGYGGSTASVEASLTKLTGDGGVDGVIDQDPLGLDRVYVQAKRYGAGNPVGAPAVREFFGALDRYKAAKGVFMTTSSFTRGAAREAGEMSKRIVLVDGDRLARLMIRHEVGCRTVERLAVLREDEDFFEG